MYKDPKVIVFDEATNALDSENERNIMREILELNVKKNLIIITHRQELVKTCNKIFAIEDGRIKEKLLNYYMNIKPCVIGLGYVGLPLILNLSKKFNCIGFDINDKRIQTLRNKRDLNKEFSKKDFFNKKIYFTNNSDELINANFYIICVPTPVYKNKQPDLKNLNQAIKIISKKIKKGDIIFIESTIFPGLTETYKIFLEKISGLKENKDFFIGYSPERVNPGDKIHTINNINKIVSINSKNISIKKNIFSL